MPMAILTKCNAAANEAAEKTLRLLMSALNAV